MKKIITTLLCAFAIVSQMQAQTTSTVSMGTSYGNNMWYSLASAATVGTSQAANNWDIALAATTSQSSALITSALINPKIGTLYVITGATPTNFSAADTTGMAWTPLYNDDKTWSTGAFNKASTGGLDYGYGSYNISNHSIEANKVFLIRYTTATPNVYTYKKLCLTLNTVAGTYSLVYDKLDNSDPQTATITISTYNTKNFLYYSLTNNAVVDREPVATTWDLLFTQYVSTSELYKSSPDAAGTGAANQVVGGVLLNKGVKAAQANNVADRTTYQDHASQTFTSDINTIGWDWKYLTASFAWAVVSDTVYFVQVANGDIYSLYFTSFGGSGNGNFNFTQEKVSTVTGIFGEASDKASLAVYPNPTASGNATVIYDFAKSNNSVLTVSDLTGNVVYAENIPSASGLSTYTFSTSSLKTGLYIVSLNADGGVLQQKLMVK